MKKPTKQQCAEYFSLINKFDTKYWLSVKALEERMQNDVGNRKLEFFWMDGNVVGIGTIDRKMKLIHRYK